MIREYDTVRIVRLLDDKSVLGMNDDLSPPQIGDIGTVIDIRETDYGDTIYTVERVAANGQTEWLAEFRRAEIEVNTTLA